MAKYNKPKDNPKDKMKKQIEVMELHMKPKFFLDSKTLPEIKDWKVGEKYNIILSVKQVGMRQDEEGLEASFEILDAEVKD